jgi:hypothetical protein
MPVNAIELYAPCNHLAFFKWLQGHLIPCPFKYLTGIDCPGCGFQRSVLALVQGDLHQSFQLYPPAIPLLLFFAYGIADGFFKLDTKKGVVKKTLFILIGSMVMISYIIKLYHFYAIYKASA